MSVQDFLLFCLPRRSITGAVRHWGFDRVAGRYIGECILARYGIKHVNLGNNQLLYKLKTHVHQ